MVETSRWNDIVPQNNRDKILSEQEKQAWVKFATAELSNQVLDSLTVDVNWTKKYVKDILHYNSDITSIMNNPEEVIKLQLFLKKKVDSSIAVNWVYDNNTSKLIDAYRKNASPEWEMANFQKNFPQFRSLVQSYPNRFGEFKNRALLFNDLKKVKEILESNATLAWPLIKNNDIKNISTIMMELAMNQDNSTFANWKVTTKIEWWNDGSSINYNWTWSEDITYADYIARLTSKVGLVSELFGAKTESKQGNLESSQKEQLSRVKIFTDSMIARNPSLNMDNKKEVETIYRSINSWNITSAINSLNSLSSKKLNGLRVDFATQEWLAHGLRAIWDTVTAWKIMQWEIITRLDTNDSWIDNKYTLDRYKSTFAENEWKVELNPRFRWLVDKKFNEMLDSITDDPTSEYYYLVNDIQAQEKVKETMKSLIAFDETMKEVWPDWLWDLAEVYNDMKWLNWVLNFTDENKKMTKEMAIMLISMVATAWVWTLASWVWAWFRLAQAWRMARVTELAWETWVKASVLRNSNRVWVLWAKVWAKAFELSASWINALNKIPVIWNATVFTTVDMWLKWYFKDEWEMVASIDSFARNLATNSAMFGMFHGVWKMTEWIIWKFWIENAFAKFWTLASWDVAWMYVLNLIETWNYTPTAEEWSKIATQAVWFRVLMKWMEKTFPKINEKINAMNKKANLTIHDGIVIGKDWVRRSTGVANKATLERNMSDETLPLETRMKEAERLLWRELTSEQKIALEEAHNMEAWKNVAKWRRLMKEWFTREETQILMDKWIAGEFKNISNVEGTVKEWKPTTIEWKDNVDTFINRDRFRDTKADKEWLTKVNLEEIWLPDITIVKYKNSWESQSQYKIEWLQPVDNNLYSLSGVKIKIKIKIKQQLGEKWNINLPVESKLSSVESILKDGLLIKQWETFILQEDLWPNLPAGTKINWDFKIMPDGKIIWKWTIELPNWKKIEWTFNEKWLLYWDVNISWDKFRFTWEYKDWILNSWKLFDWEILIKEIKNWQVVFDLKWQQDTYTNNLLLEMIRGWNNSNIVKINPRTIEWEFSRVEEWLLPDLRIPEEIQTPEQAKSWLKNNWGRLALWTWALLLTIWGIKYLANKDDKDEVILMSQQPEIETQPETPTSTKTESTTPASETKSGVEIYEKPANKPNYDLSKSEATVEVLLKDKEWVVSVKSSLNIRNSDWRIVWSFKAWEAVKLTWNVKKSNWLRFVEIAWWNYVAEKYLKFNENTQNAWVNEEKKSDSKQENQQENLSFTKEQLLKWVNIKSENWYNEFIKATKLEGQPTYDELKNQIEKYDSSKSLSMSFEDWKINVYYGDIRENNRANHDSYPINNENVQKYVMKYGEIVNWKFEKAWIWARNFKFDDLWNNK